MNSTAVLNTTGIIHSIPLASTNGIIIAIIGVLLFIVAGYIVYKILKNLVANAIIGGIGLIVLHFLGPIVGLPIPLSVTNIIISIIAGLPGLVIVVLLSLLHL